MNPPVDPTEVPASGSDISDVSDVSDFLCDRCGARARIRVALSSGGELLFCGHHARTHSTALKKVAAYIQGLS